MEEESFPAEAVVAITCIEEVEISIAIEVNELSATGASEVEHT